MKRLLYIFVSIAFAACAESSDVGEQLNIGEGSVVISTAVDGFVAQVQTKTDGLFEIPDYLLPSSEELSQFELHITGTYYSEGDNPELMEFDETYQSIEAYNTMGESMSDSSTATPPYLPAGDYTATITDNRDRTAEGEGAEYGCFSGEMNFTIVARDYSAQKTITAKMENSMVRLQITSNYETYFPESSLIITTEGGATFTFDFPLDGESLEQLAFVEAGTKLYLSGEATKQDPGTGSPSTVTLLKSEIGSAMAGGMTTITVDAASAGTFTVSVNVNDEVTQVYEQEIDLNDIVSTNIDTDTDVDTDADVDTDIDTDIDTDTDSDIDQDAVVE